MAPKAKTKADAEEGTVEVIIAFDPNDMSRNGTTDRVLASKAAQMVYEGRARYADPDNAPPSNLVVTPTPAEPGA